MKNIEKALEKIKYSVFGKVKVKSTCIVNEMKLKVSNDHLIQNQRIQIESGLQRINEIKHSKGKTGCL